MIAAPPDRIWERLPHLALEGLTPEKRRRRTLVMLTAYVDDGGRGHRPVFCLAGFVASAEQWATFVDKWQPVLDAPSPGRAPLAYFKTHEAMTLSRQFAGWTEPERDRCLDRLAGIVRESVRLRIHVSFPVKHYKQVVKGRIARGMDTPYSFGVSALISRVLMYSRHEHGIDEPVDFVLDEQSGGDRRLVDETYVLMQRMTPPEFRHLLGKAPTFRDDKDTLPLQAADLLAWHISAAQGLLRRRGVEYESATWTTLRSLPALAFDYGRTDLMRVVTGLRDMAKTQGVIYPYDLPLGHPRRGR